MNVYWSDNETKKGQPRCFTPRPELDDRNDSQLQGEVGTGEVAPQETTKNASQKLFGGGRR